VKANLILRGKPAAASAGFLRSRFIRAAQGRNAVGFFCHEQSMQVCAHCGRSVAVPRLNTKFATAPRQIIVHLPWFVDLKSTTADGKAVLASDGTIALRPEAREIHLHWAIKPGTPHLSYERAVETYKAEYARRYRILMHGDAAKQ
jgi:hypothetical protein